MEIRDVGADELTELELASETVFSGCLLHVRSDRVRLPDGMEARREYIRHPGAVVIVAVDEDGRLIFERQFRYPLRASFVELPAGKLEPGEDSLVCARRELLEETGYQATHWEYRGVMHPCIGYSDERIEIFFARGLSQHGRQLDEGEFLEVFSLSRAQVEEGIANGEITDGKTIVAFYRCLELL